MSIFELFKNRRSIREYSNKKVPDEVLQRILEAGRWAPSAHNAQPWRFIILKDQNLKLLLAEQMAAEWSKDLKLDKVPQEKIKTLTDTSIKIFSNAPVIIIVCLTMENMDVYPDEKRKKFEYIMSVQSVAAAIENILLAASLEGLGACWFCAPLFCQSIVQKILGIPKHIEPQALITIGYPRFSPSPSSRKSLKEIVYVDKWGVKWDSLC
ncbi:MAG: nitroreductase family protein [Candidatus Bathyarchaeia archaeon]